MQSRKTQIVPVGYDRASSEENQHRQFHTLPAQAQRRGSWAESVGAKFLREFSDKASGKDFNRPGFRKMWAYCKSMKGIVTHVICTSVDRFGREGAEYVYWVKRFREIGVEVNFCDQWMDFTVPDVWALFMFQVGSAEAERMKIGDRTFNTKNSIREQGYYNDRPPTPWRYAPDRDEKNRKQLIRNEPYFTAYRKAVRWYARHDEATQAEAVRRFSTDTCRLNTSTFSRLLRNPLTCGDVAIPARHQGKKTEKVILDIVTGTHPALITREEYEAIQAKLNQKAAPTIGQIRGRFNEDFPVKTLLSCPICSGIVRAYNTTNRHGKQYGYYDCPHHYRMNRDRLNATLAALLNSFQVSSADRHLMDRAADQVLADAKKSGAKREADAKARLSRAEQHIKRLKADYPALGADLFRDMMKEAQAEERAAQAALKQAQRERTIEMKSRDRLIEKMNRFGDWWVSASPFQQYEAVRMFFPEGLTVEKSQVQTPRLNRIITILFSQSSHYGKGQAEQPALILENPGCGRVRADFQTLERDLQLVQDFLAVA